MKLFLSSVENNVPHQALEQLLKRRESSEMKLLLSAVDTATDKIEGVRKVAEQKPLLWNLMSYYYLRSDEQWAETVRECSRLVMIDSGAHSFQKGKKVEWDSFTHAYAEFIRRFDRPNVVGYFEMDVDNLIGYENVLRLRKILEQESGHADKIIPVWHKNRGIEDFKDMCRTHQGRTVAITGFKNEDIRDEQYPMFLKYAWKHGCKVHCLGMARKSVLDKVPFDYCDASSWAQRAIFGRVKGAKVKREFSKTNRTDVFMASYLDAMDTQLHYWQKWRKVCHDPFKAGGSEHPASTKLGGKMKEKHSTMKVALTVIYVAALLVSNVTTGKQVELPLGLSMTAAAVVFPITYVLSDVFSECYGYKWSRKTCYMAFGAQAMAVALYMMAVALPPASYYEGQEAFASVLGNTPRIAGASLIAFFCGDWANDRVFQLMKEHSNGGRLFGLRAIASSVAGEITDTVVCMPLMFLGVIPMAELAGASACELCAKLLVEVLVLPITYRVKNKVNALEEVNG